MVYARLRGEKVFFWERLRQRADANVKLRILLKVERSRRERERIKSSE
jgi:hypothetical protein